MEPHNVYRGGILGLGGVGRLGVMIARATGHHVTVISSSEAMEHLHAYAFLLYTDEAEMEKASNSIDYILDIEPALHSLRPYISLLKVEGRILLVGAAPQFLPSHLKIS